jgi:hypothetical protein
MIEAQRLFRLRVGIVINTLTFLSRKHLSIEALKITCHFAAKSILALHSTAMLHVEKSNPELHGMVKAHCRQKICAVSKCNDVNDGR